MTDQDKLKLLFDKQIILQEKIGFNPIIYKQEYINLMAMGIITETCEALEQTKWKPWKTSAQINKKELQNEIIDIWHFLINLTLASGLNPETLFNKFMDKHKINIKRQENGY